MTDPTKFWELDKAILELLPNEGARIGKYLPDAKGVVDIKKALGDSQLTSNIVSTRLRVMKLAGLVVNVAIIGRHTKGQGWQRTQAAVLAMRNGRPE